MKVEIEISKKIVEKYDLQNIIGRGGFAWAFSGIDKEKGNKVVIKQVNIGKYEGHILDLCIQEGKLLSSLSHENIVKCHECFIEDNYQYIVMEYIEGGDLSNIIEKQKKSGEKFDEFIIIKWILEISKALKYCNEKNVIHRDIKPNNILIDQNNSAKLADFGVSRILERKSEVASTYAGTEIFMAPEVLQRKKYSFSCDIWSLGIVLFELCFLNHPLRLIPSDQMTNYLRGKFPKLKDKKYSEEISDLIEKMLNPDPDKRIKIDELIQECEKIKKKVRIDVEIKDGKLHGKFFSDNGERFEGEIDKNFDGKGTYYFNNGNRYNGEIKNFKFEGKGIIFYKNGNKYEGYFKEGKKEGKGTIYFISGDKYEGDFKNGNGEGKGIYYYSNGNKYEGDFKEGLKEGKGKLTFADGDIYDGEWKKNKVEGKGIFYYSNGNKYEGDFKNGSKEGKGIIYYDQGNKYEGNWENDKPNGKGIYYFKDGGRYEGEVKNGLRHGKGILYKTNGDKFDGNFIDDNISGLGTYYYSNGDKYEGNFSEGYADGKGNYYSHNGEKYEGDWKRGKKDGKGISYFIDGNIYEGDFKNGEIEGDGTITFKNGDKYIGGVKNMHAEGKGILYFQNGNKYDGDWKEGLREGKGIQIYSNGDKYDGDWKDSEKEGKGIFYIIKMAQPKKEFGKMMNIQEKNNFVFQKNKN